MKKAYVDEGIRQASAMSRMVANLNWNEDELDGLSMPAITKLKARSDSRNRKIKARSHAVSQPKREQTRASLQKIRHAERTRASRAKMEIQNMMSYEYGSESAALA